MARISGVNIPTNKKVNIALTYIFGIGNKIATDICESASVDVNKRVTDLNDDELITASELIASGCSVNLGIFNHADKNNDDALNVREARHASNYIFGKRCPRNPQPIGVRG